MYDLDRSVAAPPDFQASSFGDRPSKQEGRLGARWVSPEPPRIPGKWKEGRVSRGHQPAPASPESSVGLAPASLKNKNKLRPLRLEARWVSPPPCIPDKWKEGSRGRHPAPGTRQDALRSSGAAPQPQQLLLRCTPNALVARAASRTRARGCHGRRCARAVAPSERGRFMVCARRCSPPVDKLDAS